MKLYAPLKVLKIWIKDHLAGKLSYPQLLVISIVAVRRNQGKQAP